MMNQPLALVLGDISLVRALGRAGIPVALATVDATEAATRSRYCKEVIVVPNVVDAPGDVVDAVVAWSRTQSLPPVIFCQGDDDLLAFSRAREKVLPHARLPMPAASLVEDLVDKVRFAALAAVRRLPVPETRVLSHHRSLDGLEQWSSFPCVAKPSMRAGWVGSVLQRQARGPCAPKALHIENREQLLSLAPLLVGHDTDVILQAAIEGGEDRIVSYHCFARGGIVIAEFTGKKVRTSPRRYGFSTCVEITDDAEVKAAGRNIVATLGFAGVLKMDFKRALDGRLYLLEINPRFNLWHHVASVAGMSLPALVYDDCTGTGSGGAVGVARTGTRWITTRDDLRAFPEHRAAGELSVGGWLRDVATADVNEDLCWTDPLPGLIDLSRVVRRRLSRRTAGDGLRVTVVAPADFDEGLRKRWGLLQDGNPSLQSPYFSFGFTAAVATVRDDVRVAVLERENVVVGFFPYESRFGMARPVGGPLSDHHGVISAPTAQWQWPDLLRGARLAWWQFDHLEATQAPPNSTAAASPAIDLRRGFAAWKEGRGRRVSELDRKARKLAREVGPLRFVAHAVSDVDDPVLARVLALKSEQCRRTGVADVFAPSWTRWLVQLLVRTETPSLAGRLSALYAGDQLVAAHFGMCSAQVWHWWFPVYDHAHARHSPGALLLLAVAGAAAAAGKDIVDLGKGADVYKASFADLSLPLAEGRATRPAAATTLVEARDAAMSWARASTAIAPLRPLWRRVRDRALTTTTSAT